MKKLSWTLTGVLNLCLSIGVVVPAMGKENVPLNDAEKKLLERSTQDYWNQIYPPEVPRAFDVHRNGCPVCGDAIKKHGMYSWILDPTKPFKVQCPECKTVFPDNDFEAYLKSGMKDKSLLTGKYIDDGRGWRPAEGKPKYWFVAYYNHWINYQDKEPVDKTDAIRLAKAYRRTGDPAFARRALAYLDHLADYYPGYNYNKQSRYAEEVFPGYNGRFVNSIWEALFTNQLGDAYLATRDFLKQDDAELTQVTGKTSQEIKKNIEERIFRTVISDVTNNNGKNHGNYGMHQRALLKAAWVLNEPEHAKWITDFRTGGELPLEYAFYNSTYSDGAPLESPGYNVEWQDTFIGMFRILKELGVDEFAKHKVLHHIFTYGSKLMVCGKFFAPSSGDSGDTSNVASYTGLFETNRLYYELFPSPYSARMLMLDAKKHDPELYEKISKEADMDFGYQSNLLASYGFGTLQNGNREAPTAVVLAFPKYRAHMHYDLLHLDFFAENTSLIPDFGYPDSASADDPLLGFYLNTVSHNTVVMDRIRQQGRYGSLHRYDSGDFAQYVSANASVYGAAQLYRRSVLVLDAAPGKTVVFDVFNVVGGSQHDWFMHIAGETASANVPFAKQHGGTLAGKDVPYGTFYDSPEHQKMLNGSVPKMFYSYSGSGFQFLTNVRSASEKSNVVLTFPVTKSKAEEQPLPGAALKMHLLDNAGTVYLSEGKPPVTQRNPQTHVMFVDRRRSGKAPLKSCFSTILENTSNARAKYDVVSAQPLPAGDGVSACKVTLKNGTVLYAFIAENQADFTCDGFRFKAHAGAVKLAGNTVEAYVNGGGEILYNGNLVARSADDMEAFISKVNLEEESIELDREIPQSFVGHVFRANNCFYQVDKIEGNKVFLRDQSMLRGRARFMKHASEDKKSAAPTPGLNLITSNLALYRGVDKSIYAGRETYQDGKVVSDTELALNEDYWFSECGPGDRVVFQSSQREKNTGIRK